MTTKTKKIQNKQNKYNEPKRLLKIDFGCGQNCTVGIVSGKPNCHVLNGDVLTDAPHDWVMKGKEATCRRCGTKGEKYTGVDFVKCEGVDVVHDLTKVPYPFKDESVAEIVSNHFVEHLSGEDWMKHFNECYRILVKGGTMRVVHPYCFSARAFQDPTHKTFIPAERYYYVRKDWRKANRLDHYPLTCDFQADCFVTYHNDKGENWMLKSEENRNFSMAHNVNVVADLIVQLIKL